MTIAAPGDPGNEMEVIESALMRVAVAQPNRLLLVAGSRQWTYGSIWISSLRVARWLSEQGVSRGDRIVLHVSHRDASFVIGYLGTHLAGAIAVPVDEKSGDGTRSSIDAQVQPAVTLTQASLAPFLDQDDALLPNGEEVRFADPSDCADIMFTSGTTGTPKGVALTHRAIAAAASSINAFVGNGSEDREVVTVPLSHSFGLGRLRCTILAGGTLILVPGLTFPALVFKALQAHRATGLVCVPTGVAVLLKAGEQKLADCASHLRYMEIGSAPMPIEAKRRLMSVLPRTRLCMHYGLTEASRSAFIEFHADAAALDSVGKPSPNVEIAIYSEHGDPATGGRIGRIKIRSRAVMKEYWRNPELTSSTIGMDGWLDTGDLGRYDERGYLYLEGRRDDVINVGGKKVYPASVENAALQHEDVAEAACVGEVDPEQLLGEVVTLFVVIRKAAAQPPAAGEDRKEAVLNEESLRTFLASRLDPYAVPRRVIFLDALPRTESGKLQRAALKRRTRVQGAESPA